MTDTAIVAMPWRNDWSEAEKAAIDTCVANGMDRDAAYFAAALHRQAERKRNAKLGTAGTGQCPRPGTTVPDVVRPVPDPTEATSRGASGDPDLDGAPRASGTAPDGHRPSTLRRRFSSEYQSWLNMKKRRNDGFRVDEIWLGRGGFEQFLDDMGAKHSPQHTLDRADPEVRAYGPGLCRWADKKEQTRNRRNTVFLTDRHGVSRSLGEWAEVTDQTYDALRKRCQRHRHEWTQHEIIYGRSDKPERFAGDPLDLTPWPGDRETKLRWERAYRENKLKGEHRLGYLVRRGKRKLQEILDSDLIPPVEIHPGVPYEPNEVEREALALYDRINAIVLKARAALDAQLRKDREQRWRRSALDRAGDLGKDAERALDAAAFGYDCRDYDADRGDRGEVPEDEDEDEDEGLEVMREELGL